MDRDRPPASLPPSLGLIDSERSNPNATGLNADIVTRQQERDAVAKHYEEFEEFIEMNFIPFMEKHKLDVGTLTSSLGAKATVKKNKHGFFQITITKKKTNV